MPTLLARTARLFGFGMLIAMLLATTSTTVASADAAALHASTARAALAQQKSVALEQRQQLSSARLAAAAALEQLVASSTNHVLDPAVLTAAALDIAAERHNIFVASLSTRNLMAHFLPVPFGSAAALKLEGFRPPLHRYQISLDKAAVGAAVLAWQNRPIPVTPPVVVVTAPKRAAAHVAAPAASPQSGPKEITVNVRTTVNTSQGGNGQAEINAGGEVGVIYPAYGTIVSAHDTNDPRALSLVPGDIVNFTGAVNGRYRVTGLINVPKGAEVRSVAALGQRMMMQTCIFHTNQMRIVGLEPA